MLRLKRICLEDLSDVRGTIPEDGDDYLEESGIEASSFIDWGMINFINDFIDNLQMVDLPVYPNRKPNDNKGNVKSMSRYYIDAQADLMSMPIPKLYKKMHIPRDVMTAFRASTKMKEEVKDLFLSEVQKIKRRIPRELKPTIDVNSYLTPDTIALQILSLNMVSDLRPVLRTFEGVIEKWASEIGADVGSSGYGTRTKNIYYEDPLNITLQMAIEPVGSKEDTKICVLIKTDCSHIGEL